jgi:plastocyanin
MSDKRHGPATERRTFVKAMTAAMTAGLAGCKVPQTGEDGSTVTVTDGAGGVGAIGGVSADLARQVRDVVPTDVTVQMRSVDGDNEFDPPVVQTVPGGQVTWDNVSGTHTATAYHADNGARHRVPNQVSPFDSGELAEGESFAHTFEQPGVYNYFCRPHEDQGMVGVVIVGDPSPLNQPGTARPTRTDFSNEATRSRLSELVMDARRQLALPIVTEVDMKTTGGELVFDPDVARVRRGGVTLFTNVSGSHSTTAYHSQNDKPRRIPPGATPWDSTTLSDEGASFAVAINTTGVYDYFCIPHEADGMVGSVVVGAPSSLDDEPGLAPPQSSLSQAEQDAIRRQNERTRTILADERLGPAPPDEAGDTADGVVMVSARGSSFSPDLVEIEPGETVRWEVINSSPHSVIAYDGRIPDGADPFASELLDVGETFEHTFETEGIYDYFCEPHELSGMVGSVIVGDPDPADQPALTEPGSTVGAPAAVANLTQRTRSALAGGSSVTPDTQVEATQINGEPIFDPVVAFVEAGDTVTWSFDGAHSVTAYHPDNDQPQRVPDGTAGFDSGSQTEGTFEHTFDEPGVYVYYCTPHHTTGMVGAVVVGSPDLSQEPGMAPPQDRIPSRARSELESVVQEIRVQKGDPSTEVAATVDAATRDSEFVFDPGVVTIDTGQTIEWQFSGSHSVTAYHPDNNGKPRLVPQGAAAFDSGTQSGGSYRHTFVDEGVYAYYCVPHESVGMVGLVVVGDPPLADAVALSPPDSLGTQAKSELESLAQQVSPDSGGGQAVEVAAGVGSENVFDPELVRIDPGDTVRWTFDGAHSVTAYHPDNDGKPQRVPDGTAAFDSGTQSSGTFEHTFETAGVYDYYCIPHESLGMVGKVIVGDPALDAQPGMAPPQNALAADAASTIEALNAQASTSGGGGGTEPTPDATIDAVTTADGNTVFQSDLLYVSPGDTVAWSFDGFHSVTAYHADNGQPQRVPDGAAAFDSGTMGEGTFQHTFETEGVYDYFCSPHHRAGMVGTIVVGNPSNLDAERGMAAPQSTIPAEAATQLQAIAEQIRADIGGSGGSPTTGNTASGTSDFNFEPQVLRIEVGETVTWNQMGNHSATAYHPNNDKPQRVPDGASSFNSGVLDSGQTFSHTFETAGIFEYFCLPHEGAGMVAAVIVGTPSNPTAEPGLAQPQSSLPAPEAVHSLNQAVASELGTTVDYVWPPDGDGTSGGGDTGGDTGSGGTGDVGAEVTPQGTAFDPDLVSIEVGQSVVWSTSEFHSVTAYHPDNNRNRRVPSGTPAFDSGERSGFTFEHTFNTEGIYDYFCIPHEGNGMVGSVVVGNPDTSNQPGLSEPATGDTDTDSALSLLNQRTLDLLGGTLTTVSADETITVDTLDMTVVDGTAGLGNTITVAVIADGARVTGLTVTQDKPTDATYTTDDEGTFTTTLEEVDGDRDFRYQASFGGASAGLRYDFD